MANSATSESALSLKIRPIERSDLRQMLEIFSEAIPHSQLSRSIYLAPGAEAFLAHLLDYPGLQSAEQLWGVDSKEHGLVGAAHTRLIGEFHHLNNYAVLPRFQGHGIGARMMAHWHAIARGLGATKLSLDVALENVRACKHYAAFGFMEVARTHEYRWQGTADEFDTSKAHLHDWSLAQASLGAYGFGRFVVELGAQRWTVDLRSEDFRVSSTQPELLAVLRRMNSARTLLLRTSKLLEDESSWSYTGAVLRMTKDIAK
jgi:ribosomal protein S18 acetylase RimI-like enzyme